MTDLGTLQQHHLVMQLLRLSREQGDALRRARVDRFLELMEEREALIAQLGDTLAAPPPSNVVAFPSVSSDNVVSDARAAVRGLLASVVEQDRDNGRLLREQLGQLQAALARIGGAPVDESAVGAGAAARSSASGVQRTAPRRKSRAADRERSRRVAALKAQVRAGNYAVDIDKLAEKLLGVL